MKELEWSREIFRQSSLRFIEYYVDLSEKHMYDYGVFEEEIENIVGSLGTACDLGEWKTSARLINSTGPFCERRGLWDERRYWLELVIQQINAQEEPELFLELTHGLATTANAQGEFGKAIAMYQEVVHLAEERDDYSTLLLAAHLLGVILADLGQKEDAIRYWQKALQVAEKTNSDSMRDQIQYFMHLYEAQEKEYETSDSSDVVERGAAIGPEIEPFVGEIAQVLPLHFRARAAFSNEKYSEAKDLYLRALEIALRVDDKQAIALTLCELGRIASVEGDTEIALEYYLRSETIATETKDLIGLRTLFPLIGFAYFKQQRFHEARPYWERSVALSRQTKDKRRLAENLYWLGYAFANTDDLVRAEHTFEESLTLTPKSDKERVNSIHEALERIKSLIDPQPPD
jgi:tetratricopeptide (TPR) repeat protein